MGDDGAAGSQHGAWKGSNVTEMEILMLRRARKLPRNIDFRIPGPELVPMPEPGERVVFRAHFDRGFGLPVSKFSETSWISIASSLTTSAPTP